MSRQGRRRATRPPARCPDCGRQWAEPTSDTCGMCEVFAGRRVKLVPLTREIQQIPAHVADLPTSTVTSLIPCTKGRVSRS